MRVPSCQLSPSILEKKSRLTFAAQHIPDMKLFLKKELKLFTFFCLGPPENNGHLFLRTNPHRCVHWVVGQTRRKKRERSILAVTKDFFAGPFKEKEKSTRDDKVGFFFGWSVWLSNALGHQKLSFRWVVTAELLLLSK